MKLAGLRFVLTWVLSVASLALGAPAVGAAAAATADTGCPRQFSSGGAALTMYQPQLDAWDGRRLQAHAAVSVRPAGSNVRPSRRGFVLSSRNTAPERWATADPTRLANRARLGAPRRGRLLLRGLFLRGAQAATTEILASGHRLSTIW